MIGMPREGHKSITIDDDLYDELWNKWESEKPVLRKKGIKSFSAYVSRYLWDVLEESKK